MKGMDPEILIRDFEERDKEGCLLLLGETFPGQSNARTFRWRFENSPKGKPILLCAHFRDRIVSFNSWIPWEFQYGGRKFIGYQSGESATHPDFRGKGIFSEILRQGETRARNLEIDFLFGFPSEMSYGAFYRQGYYPIAQYRYCIRPLNVFWRRPGERAPGDAGPSPPPARAGLLQREKITPVFDAEYLRWRYLENSKEYAFAEFRENNLEAFFALRENRRRFFREVLILDLQVNTFQERFLEKSLRSLAAKLPRSAAFVRTFFNEDTDRGRALKKYFFHIRGRDLTLIIRPLRPTLPEEVLLNRHNWDVMPHIVDEL
jgi:hypothetical protein